MKKQKLNLKHKNEISIVCFSALGLFMSVFLLLIIPLQASESFSHADIVRDSIIFDLHCDTVYRFYRLRSMKRFASKGLQVTLPRLKQAGVKAQFFAVWVPPKKGFKHANNLIDIFEKMIDKNSDSMAFAGSYSALQHNLAEGKISAFLAIEGGKAIYTKISRLAHFYNRGVRSMTLTWNFNNRIADASGSRKRRYGGLSPFGEQVVEKMNQLGMIIDVSHSADATVKDILKITTDPVIASHSCCYAHRRFHRNVKDELIEGICKSGGVIGVNFYSKHLTAKKYATASTVADHIDHVVQIGGINCAAIGSDYDGMPRPAKGLENIGKLENLTNELIKRGYSKGDIEKIYGLNTIRVVKRVLDN